MLPDDEPFVIATTLTPNMLAPLDQPGSRSVVAYIPPEVSAPATLIITDFPPVGALAAISGWFLFHFDAGDLPGGVVTLSWLPPGHIPGAKPTLMFVWEPSTVVHAFMVDEAPDTDIAAEDA